MRRSVKSGAKFESLRAVKTIAANLQKNSQFTNKILLGVSNKVNFFCERNNAIHSCSQIPEQTKSMIYIG